MNVQSRLSRTPRMLSVDGHLMIQHTEGCVEVLLDHPAKAWAARRQTLHELRWLVAGLWAAQMGLLLLLSAPEFKTFEVTSGQMIFMIIMTLGYAGVILMMTIARNRTGTRPHLKRPLTDADAMRLLWWAERLEAREILVDITTRSGSISYADADYVMKEVQRRAPRQTPIDVLAIRAAAGI